MIFMLIGLTGSQVPEITITAAYRMGGMIMAKGAVPIDVRIWFIYFKCALN